MKHLVKITKKSLGIILHNNGGKYIALRCYSDRDISVIDSKHIDFTGYIHGYYVQENARALDVYYADSKAISCFQMQYHDGYWKFISQDMYKVDIPLRNVDVYHDGKNMFVLACIKPGIPHYVTVLLKIDD